MDFLYSIVEAVWHFVFYLGEYTPKWLGMTMVGIVLAGIAMALLYPILIAWWLRALIFGGTIAYYQYRIGDQIQLIEKDYRVRHRYTWAARFILGLLFSPRRIWSLSNSNVSLGAVLSISFYRILPRVSRSKDLDTYIANGWTIPPATTTSPPGGRAD